MTKVQILKKSGRPTFAVLEIDEYKRMVAALEDAEDLAAIRAARADPGELVPSEIAERLIDGENPIRVWRAHRGLTQAQLAERSGVRQDHISKIESGKLTGSVKALRTLAGALDVDLDDLV